MRNIDDILERLWESVATDGPDSLRVPALLTGERDCMAGGIEAYYYDDEGREVSRRTVRRDYVADRVFSTGELLYSYFPGGYFDAEGAPHYLHTDYQGSVVMVTDSAGTIEQHTTYYPYGEPHRAPSGQPILYGGKERLATTDDYNYGTRRHHAPAINWPTPDPLSNAFYTLSPYSFCAGNPIRYIDPNGMYWKEAAQQKALIDEISELMNYLTEMLTVQNINSELKADLESRVELLNKSLADVETIANDKDVAYSISNVDGDGAHYVKQDGHNNVVIEASSTALAVHEIRHVGQSLEMGELSFNSDGKLLNTANSVKDVKERNKLATFNEVEAYRHQYAFDPESMPIAVNGINLIDIHYVGSIEFNNQPAYPFAKQHRTIQRIIELSKKR